MAFRLVATVEGRTVRVALGSGEHVLGSHPECAIRLPHPSISRRHAALRVESDHIVVEDLKSRNGTRVAGRRVSSHVWLPGTAMHFGAVAVWLEDVTAEDLEAGVVLSGFNGCPPASWTGEHSTHGSGPVEAFALQHLPGLLRRLCQGVEATTMAQAVGEAVYAALPCLEVEVTARRGGGLVFRVARGGEAGGAPFYLEASGGPFALRVGFPSAHLARSFAPLVDCAAGLVEAAASDKLEAPPAQGDRGALPSLPDPPTVVPAVRDLFAAAARVARGDVGVLILGESGTGKELLARYIHAASPFAGGPFLGLNCASLPHDLLEAELFGVEKGVATGVDARPGKFELADGGTLFLDEVADMAPETQARILRVLQSGEVYRLGGREPRTVRVRTIAATNRNVRAMLHDGRFREDLYHRIAAWVVQLPPLRQRRADIPNLAAYFLGREGRRHGVRVAGISRAALETLTACPWPGNVRQLENEMARAALFLEDGELLDTSRLSDEVVACRPPASGSTLSATLEKVERDEIVLALASCGDIDGAAARLGVSRATLYRRIKALGIRNDPAPV